MAHAIYQFWGAGEMNFKKQNKTTSLACPSVARTFRKVTCEAPLLRVTLGFSGMWLQGEQVSPGFMWREADRGVACSLGAKAGRSGYQRPDGD